jgi:hypothetical protein
MAVIGIKGRMIATQARVRARSLIASRQPAVGAFMHAMNVSGGQQSAITLALP